MKLRFPFLLALILVALMARGDETWVGSSDVKFKGRSTLHNFDGTLKQVPLKVKVSTGKDDRLVSATSDAPVKEMSTDNHERDQNMMNMFNEAKFRLIKIEVPPTSERVLKPVNGKPGSMAVNLTIAGVRGSVNASVTNVSEAPKDVTFDLAFPVSLKAFNLHPPAGLGGLVSVRDTVDVTAHVTLKKKE